MVNRLWLKTTRCFVIQYTLFWFDGHTGENKWVVLFSLFRSTLILHRTRHSRIAVLGAKHGGRED